MLDQAIAIYCFLHDLLKKLHHPEDCRRQVNDAQVLTTAVLAALHFGGNYAKALCFMRQFNAFSTPLSRSRYCRRLHQVRELLVDLFWQVGTIFKQLNTTSSYIVDSFPVAACRNVRIRRSKLFQGKAYRGYSASKRAYFYGVKVQVVVTSEGLPVEVCFMPGSWADIEGLRQLPLDLPQGSTLYGDSAYTDYHLEELLLETQNLHLLVARKSNSHRKHHPSGDYLIQQTRKRVETTFSQITSLFPRKIHATTQQGFLLKIYAFLLAFSFNQLFPL